MKTTLMDKNLTIDVLNMHANDNKHLLLNEEFACFFRNPGKDGRFFSSFLKDSNCPRFSSFADAEVHIGNDVLLGRLCIDLNVDLGKNGEYMMTLCCKKQDDASWKQLVNVTDCLILDN